jgi:hypothetical protein
MHQELLAFVIDVGKTFLKGVPISLALAVVFTVLTWFWACNPGRPWWRKPDLVTTSATGCSFRSSRAFCVSAC